MSLPNLKELQKYRAVIFDADGVAVQDSDRFSDRHVRDHGVAMQEINPFFTGPFQDCLIGRKDLFEELEKWRGAFQWQNSIAELFDYWCAQDKAQPETLELVSRLRESGIYCCVGTNNEKYRVEIFRSKLDFAELFDDVYGSYQADCKKPNQEFYAWIHRQISQAIAEDIPADQIILLDDKQANIDGAIEYGFAAHLVRLENNE